MSEQLDPSSGLPISVVNNSAKNPSSSAIDPSSGLPVNVVQNSKVNSKLGNVGVGFAGGISQNLTKVYTDPLESYKDYDVNTSIYNKDWNEQRAQNQPWYEQFAYGTAKAVATVGTSIVDGTLGTANGLLSLAFDKDHSFADNTIGQSMDAINEQMREWLPNYYTQEEQDSLLGALSNPANFIGDKVLGGAAYTVGALATMYLTGGMGVAGGAIRGAGLAARAGRAVLGAEAGMSELSATYKVAKALKAGENVSKALSSAATTSRYLKLAQQADVALTMSLSEAAIEARETKKQFIDEKTAEWDRENPGVEMPEALKASIEESATAAMNANFGINLAVLAGTNAITFGRMSFRKFSGQALEDDIANATYKINASKTAEGMKYTEAFSDNKFIRSFQKGSRLFGKETAGRAMFSEAFQEGAQFTSNAALQDYYSGKFDGRLQGGMSDMASSFAKGLSETFSTTAGLESMLIGAIVGGGSAMITSRGNSAKKEENTKKFLDLANTQVFSNMSEKFEKTQENLNLVAEMKKAEEEGNTTRAEALRKKLIFNHAYKYDKVGALDYAFQELDDVAQLSEDEFKKRMLYDTSKPLAEQSGGKTQQELIDDIKDTAKETIQLQKDILAIFPLVRPTGLFAAMQSDEDKKDFLLQQKIDTMYRNMLYDSALHSKVATDEANKHYNELLTINPEFAKLDKNELLYKVKVGQVKLNDEGEVEIKSTRGADITLDDVKDEKFQEQLKIARQAHRALSAVDQIKFTQTMQNLEKALAIKGGAELAFNELRKNPQNRAAYVQAKQLRDEQIRQEAADKDAAQVLENAQTSEEVETATPSNASEEALIAAKRKAAELRAQEDLAQEELKNYSDEELEAGYIYNGKILTEEELEDLNPGMAVAYKREKAQRKIKKTLNDTKQPTNILTINPETNTVGDISLEEAKTQIAEDYVEELKNIAGQVVIDSNGRQFVIQGRIYEIPSVNPTDALNFDEDGRIISVTLRDTHNNRDKVFYLKRDITEFDSALEQEKDGINLDELIPDAIAFTILMSRLNIGEGLTIQETVENNAEDIATVIEETDKVIEKEQEQQKKPNFNINNKSIAKLKAEMVTLRAERAELMSQLDALYYATVNENLTIEEFEEIPEVKELLKRLNKLQKIMDVKIEAIQYKQRGGEVAQDEVDLSTTKEEDSIVVQAEQEIVTELTNQMTILVEAKAGFDAVIANPESFGITSEQDILNAKLESERLQKQIKSLRSKIKYRNNKIATIKEKENETRIAELQQASETTSRGAVSTEGQVLEGENTNPDTGVEKEGIDTSKQMTSEEVDIAKQEAEEIEKIKTTTEENELILTNAIGAEVQPQVPAQQEQAIIITGGRLNLQLTQGEFEGVTENGDPISGNFVQQFDVDGNPIFVETDMITTSEVAIGDTVQFVVDENTQWWQENKDKYPAEDHWKYVPIFVVHNGKKIALLSAYKSSTDTNGVESIYGIDREFIYNNRALNPQATITEKLFNTSNISNARTSDGTPMFYNPMELIKQGGVGVVTSKGIEIALNINLNEEDQIAITQIQTTKIVDGQEVPVLAKGQVVIFGRNPLGGVQMFVASTKQMDEFGLTTILNHIKAESYEAIPEIVGANIILDAFISSEIESYDDAKIEHNKKLLFFEVFNNQLLFTFYSPSAKSLVRVSANALQKHLTTNTPITYSFVDVVPSEKEGVKGLDIVINKDKKNHTDFADNILEELKAVILQKRYQIDSDLFELENYNSKLNEGVTYPTYVEYITSNQEFPGQRQQGLGHNSILTVDIHLNNKGSAWNDVGLGFDNLSTSGKRVVTKEQVHEITIAQPANPETNNNITVIPSLNETAIVAASSEDLFEEFEEEQPSQQQGSINTINNPAEYTNHSGGAVGADSMFDTIGREYGQANHKHYYYGSKTPKGNVLLTEEQVKEGIAEMNKAAKILGKKPSKESTINLLARNWFQVKNSTQIVAIAPIDKSMKFVEGGTGWAVAMSQANNKEINVFNLKDNAWYKWNGATFVKSTVPILAKNFAGIGSRQDNGKMTPASIQAIRDVYNNTFKTQQPATSTSVSDNTKTPIEGLNERLNNYGNAKVILSSDFYEGERPKGRLNAFKTSIDQVANNIMILADLNLNEFSFLTEEDKRNLDALRPLAKELNKINTNDISSADRRTVAVEKRYAQLANQLVNEFVDIVGKHVEQQLGKTITSSKPKLSTESKPTQPASVASQSINAQEKSVNAINKLIEDGKKAKLVTHKGQSVYQFIGKLFQRVSNFVGNSIKMTNSSTVTNLKNSVVVGNYFDTFARAYYKNSALTVQEFKLLLAARVDAKTFELIDVDEIFAESKTQFEAIKSQIKTQLKDDNLVFITDEIFVHKEFENGDLDGVAGTLDMVVVDSKGTIHVYDFKTKSENNAKYPITPKSLETAFDPTTSSDKAKWERQQSAYAKALEEIFGYVPNINIIVIPVMYDKETFTDDVTDENIDAFMPQPYNVRFANTKPFIYKLDYNPTTFESKVDDEEPAPFDTSASPIEGLVIPAEFLGAFTAARQLTSEERKKLEAEQNQMFGGNDTLSLTGISRPNDEDIEKMKKKGEELNKQCNSGK